MEFPQFKSLSQFPEMEDSMFNFQWPVNPIDDQLGSMAGFNENRHHLHDHAPLFDYNETITEPFSRPTKEFNFHNSNHTSLYQDQVHGATNLGRIVNPKDEPFVFNGGAKVTSTNETSRVIPYQGHLLAERKRRQKLSQQFIALSALLPNLKRMDKASVLGDAIEYTKVLQERVKILEEQTQTKPNVKTIRLEAVVDGGDVFSSNDKISGVPEELPEVEARFSGRNVLIRVHCEKKLGVVENTLAEIEKLHLSVISSTAMIFANSTVHITIIAQMDKDRTMKMEDLVKTLRCGIEKFM